MPTQIRVLAVGNAYPPHHLGGYEIIWRGAMRELRRKGHHTRVLTTDYRRDDVVDREEDPDVHRQLDWYWRDHAWRRLGPRTRLQLERHNARVFKHHLDDARPDVITWWPLGGMSLGLIEQARSAGIPALFFVLDPWPAYGPPHDLWLRMWRRLSPVRGLVTSLTGLPTHVEEASAGRWLFCSNRMRELTLERLPHIADADVLTPGVDSSFLAAPPEPQLPFWRWRLLYVGRVVEQKGVRTALESLPLLPAEATLRIVGDGDAEYRRGLERRAIELAVSDRVQIEPGRPHDQLLDIYRAADAVVFPVQWAEPWGLVPLEAMAVGRPVVATGAGGSGEYLVDGENSLLFGIRDAAALAGRLRSLADDAALRERLIAGGHRTALSHSESQFNARAVAEIEAAARPQSRTVR